MTVHNIQSNEAFRETVKNNKAVLVDYFATWCGPCKVIAPLLATASNDDQFKSIHFVKVDVDQLSALADEQEIKAMPTLQLFKDGEKVGELVNPTPDTLPGFLEKGL